MVNSVVTAPDWSQNAIEVASPLTAQPAGRLVIIYINLEKKKLNIKYVNCQQKAHSKQLEWWFLPL